MRYRILACDYDGTLAHHGLVDAATLEALEKVRASGRHLVLVTGRELPDLLRVFPAVSLFTWVVAENGGLLYNPATREETPLGPEPAMQLVARLGEAGVSPLSVGRTLIATWEPHETTVLGAIRDLGLELQVIFNKGAVMVLPAGITKRTGLEAALARLESSAHECVGVGDAENDHAFLSLCECAVAVSNALPALKQAADWVTAGDHGAGVRELVDALVTDDLATLEPKLQRHHVLLGSQEDGTEFSIVPYGTVGLVAGGSGSGKTTATTGLIERIAEGGYQICIIDPEGDHDSFPDAVVTGTSEQPPEIDQVLSVLAKPTNHSVVNLMAVPFADRPRFFVALLGRLLEMRAATGRPHWIAVDEAHHVLSSEFQPTLLTLPSELRSMLFVTVDPKTLLPSVLKQVSLVVGVGEEAESIVSTFAQAVDRDPPRATTLPSKQGEALVWGTHNDAAQALALPPGKSASKRHRRKYARGELGLDKSFYFRGANNLLNLRAQNLVAFNDLADGVDDATWDFHLKNGDYSYWMRVAIKDAALAERVATIEANGSLDSRESRQHIRQVIEETYTAPA